MCLMIHKIDKKQIFVIILERIELDIKHLRRKQLFKNYTFKNYLIKENFYEKLLKKVESRSYSLNIFKWTTFSICFSPFLMLRYQRRTCFSGFLHFSRRSPLHIAIFFIPIIIID